MRFFTCFVFVALCLCMISFNVFAEETVVLKDGSPVVLRLTEEVSNKSKNLNDAVHLDVVKDIIVNGKVVIAAGTPAEGTVSVCEKPDIIGQEGTIAFIVNSTKAVDGQWVSLRSSLTRSGQSKQILSAGAAYACCPIFGLIKGEGASFPIGTEVKAYTENDLKIKVD